MNFEIAIGHTLHWLGRARERWSEWTGDELGRRRGLQLALAGQLRVTGGQAARLLRRCAATLEPLTPPRG